MLQDAELRAIVSPELYADEKLLWVGKPTPIYVLRQYSEGLVNTVFIAFMLTVFLFTCSFFGMSSISIASYSVPIFSFLLIPIAAFILYMIYLYWRAGQIVYAISNQRALIIKSTLDGRSILAYNIIPYIERRSRASGKDDLIFASETYTPLFYTNFSVNSSRSYYFRIRKVGFFGIENAREVEQLLIKTFHPKQSGSNS